MTTLQKAIEMIQKLPELNATKSRDYGRGYAQAVKDIVAILAIVAATK